MDKAEFRKRILNSDNVWQKGYEPDEVGVWQIFGEDPNPDMGGHHHEPNLGTFAGTYSDAIDHAMDLRGFFAWGGGGRIKKTELQMKTEKRANVSPFSIMYTVEGYCYERLRELLIDYPGASYTERHAITVDGKTYLLTSPDPIAVRRPDPATLAQEQTRERALAKLTSEERKALGI